MDIISLIISNENFSFHNFLARNETNNAEKVLLKIKEIKSYISKDINKYLTDISFRDKKSPAYLDMISSLLTLFSKIKNNFFFQDMLFFYHYKLIPIMKTFNRDINRQIINIILCDFVDVDKNIENLSKFIIKNLVDVLINNFIFDKKTLPKEDLVNIFEKKKIIIKILLKENKNFITKILHLIYS